MTPFLDIAGASGARYRFRAVETGDILPIEAGNFLLVRDGDDADKLTVCCGTAPSLARAADSWATSVAAHGPCLLYVRLNLSREVRLAEHADISAALRPQLVLDEVCG